MKNRILYLVLFAVLFSWSSCKQPSTQQSAFANGKVNGWIILSSDSSQVFNTIREAARYGVNHIQFSHRLIMNIDDLLKNTPEAAFRIEVLNKGIKLAHQLGMKAYVWCHEFSVEDKSDREICYAPDSPIWEKRKHAYREGLKLIPDVDGVILMFGSSPLPPWRTTCHCDWCKSHGLADNNDPVAEAARIRILTEEVGGYITNNLHKELFIRTFVHEPEETGWYINGLNQVKGVPFIAMHKSPVQDWQPYNPHNPCIGSITGKNFVVENDAAGEFMGLSILPYCAPGYYLYRLRYMKEKGGSGDVTRVGIREYSTVFGTPNFINLYAIEAFNKNTDVSLDSVWNNSIRELYGDTLSEKAVLLLKQLFGKTFYIRVKSNFVLGIWTYGENSEFPNSLDLDQFYYRGEMPKWNPDWKDLWNDLDKPDITTIRNIWQESTEAVELAKECLDQSAGLKSQLRDSVYQDLERRFTHQYLAAKAWRAIDIYTWSVKATTAGKAGPMKLADWKNWAYQELKRVLAEYEKDQLLSFPVMGYASLKKYIDVIDQSGAKTGATSFIPGKPLFSPLDVRYDKDKNSETVTFSASDRCDVKVLYGEQLPFPENSKEVKVMPGQEIKVVLDNLSPDKRYIVRLTSDIDGEHLFSGDYWFYTFK